MTIIIVSLTDQQRIGIFLDMKYFSTDLVDLCMSIVFGYCPGVAFRFAKEKGEKRGKYKSWRESFFPQKSSPNPTSSSCVMCRKKYVVRKFT